MKKKWSWLLGGLAIGIGWTLLSYFTGATRFDDWSTSAIRGYNVGQATGIPVILAFLGFLGGLTRDRWAQDDG